MSESFGKSAHPVRKARAVASAATEPKVTARSEAGIGSDRAPDLPSYVVELRRRFLSDDAPRPPTTRLHKKMASGGF